MLHTCIYTHRHTHSVIVHCFCFYCHILRGSRGWGCKFNSILWLSKSWIAVNLLSGADSHKVIGGGSNPIPNIDVITTPARECRILSRKCCTATCSGWKHVSNTRHRKNRQTKQFLHSAGARAAKCFPRLAAQAGLYPVSDTKHLNVFKLKQKYWTYLQWVYFLDICVLTGQT